jgi:hypothetical protein
LTNVAVILLPVSIVFAGLTADQVREQPAAAG